jgi:hypothetical protein
MKKVQYILVLLLCTCLSSALVAQESDLITVSGVVKDQKSHHEVEYVNVTAFGSNMGTVTNMDGVFTLKIRNVKSIEFSRIGYETVRIPVDNLKSGNNVVYIRPKTVILSEVVVSPVDADKVVTEAMRRVKYNYSDEPAMMTGFYRETIQKKKKYINISEAVTNVYKTSYSLGPGRDKVRILKGRKLISPNMKDTLAVKLVGGPTLVLTLDVMKDPSEFLDGESRLDYKYSFVDYVTIDGRNHYAIRFDPAKQLDYPLYEGVLYIDQKDYTVSRVEFRVEMRDPMLVSKMILKRKPLGLIFKPMNLSYLVDYRRQDSRSYLNYVRADIRFRCDWHKRLFHTNYSVVSEMVTTDRLNNPPERILSHDAFKENQVLSDRVEDFGDDNFWGDYNIIEPTESLEHAVQKLRKTYDKIGN